MLNLLNTLDRNHYKLITYLNSDAQPHASVGDLSNHCKCSEKTIYTYLDQIAQEWEPLLIIESYSGRYYVDEYNQKTNEQILRTFLMRSLSITLFIDIVKNPETLNEDRMKQFYISESTFYRTLRMMNKEFGSSAIQFKRNGSRPVSIVSEQEHYIRKFVTCLILELYGTKDLDDILKINLEEAKLVIQEVFDRKGIYYDSLTLIFSVTLFVVSELRERQGFHSNLSMIPATMVEGMDFSKIFEGYRDYKTTHCMQSLSEVLYYHTPILNPSETKVFSDAFLDELIAKHDYILSKDTQNFISLIHQTLLNNYTLYPFKTSLFIDRIADFMHAFYEEHPKIRSDFYQALNASQTISLNPDLYLDDLLYWSIMNCSDILEQKPKIMRILIYSDLGIQHAMYIRNNLMCRFKLDATQIPIDCMSYFELTSMDYDLCIGNTPTTSDVILIDDYPSQKQYINILRKIIF